jgi:hypothetical protein
MAGCSARQYTAAVFLGITAADDKEKTGENYYEKIT